MRWAKWLEKRLLGSPWGYATDASEGFRTVSLRRSTKFGLPHPDICKRAGLESAPPGALFAASLGMETPRRTNRTQEASEMPGEGEQLTGVSDNAYNLTSVLYHAAQGGTQYAKYIEDAEGEGDQELADFFREVQQQDAERAQRARTLLTTRQ